jgi:Ca-activated chloride channel homolog
MRWASLSWLVTAGAILVVLALAYALDFTRRRRLMEKIGHAPQIARMAASVSEGRRIAKAILVVAGICLVAVAIAGPRFRGSPIWKERGIDVVVVLDYSKSMLARDVYPSRFERTRYVADALLDKFAGNRVAVVAFAGGAVHYPLTTDYEAARILYHGIDPTDLPPGSDLGDALTMSRCLLQQGGVADADCIRVHGKEVVRRLPDGVERARAIVVFTDGEDTEGGAVAEVEKATRAGISVYLVGVGTKAGGRIPEYGENGEIRGWKLSADGQSYFTSRLDEEALKGLAKAAGGEDHYLRDEPRRASMDPVIKALSNLKEGDLEKRVDEDRVPNEKFEWVLYPAFLALLVEACLSDRRRIAAAAAAAAPAASPQAPVPRKRKRA